MPRGRKTVSNFAPEMLELFVNGAKREITVQFDDAKQAYSFAYRMNRLRQAMRDERHHMLSVAEGCQVSIDKEKKTCTVKPADTLYLGKVREALSRLPEVNEQVAVHSGIPSPDIDADFPKSRAELEAEAQARDSEKEQADKNINNFFKGE